MSDFDTVLNHLSEQLGALEGGERTGSRFAGQAASREHVERLAKGATAAAVSPDQRVLLAGPPGMRASGAGGDFLRLVKAARRGDPDAHRALASKGWVEGTGASGGFLVSPDVLPGYVEARRAASPLRERCASFDVRSDEAWITSEGANALTVQHVVEAATKPDSTGSVAQKISTVFKVAGTSHVSDELLADSNGNAAQLVSTQFAQQIGITIDTAIISGTGTGQPTGIRNAAGVNSVAVDGQGATQLYDSIAKAISRIQQRFEPVDTVVMHGRDAVKFTIAKTGGGEYLWPDALPTFPGAGIVIDANVPTNLGAGTNESVILVGGFRRGAYFFSRQPLTIDASQDAAFATDETVFRGVERYGFAVVVPGAFEVLTGITP